MIAYVVLNPPTPIWVLVSLASMAALMLVTDWRPITARLVRLDPWVCRATSVLWLYIGVSLLFGFMPHVALRIVAHLLTAWTFLILAQRAFR